MVSSSRALQKKVTGEVTGESSGTVGVRSPVMAESRWTSPVLLEEAGEGPISMVG